MSISISKADKKVLLSDLSSEIREEILEAVQNELNEMPYDAEEFAEAWEKACAARVCDLEDLIQIDYVDDKLTYYVYENLRYQQDGFGSSNITRFEKLDDAIAAYNDHPGNYTSALGCSLTGGKFGIGEFDLVHRKNGESVLIDDFKYMDRWKEHSLVRRAADTMISKLHIEYESDLRIFGKSVLIPLQRQENEKLNSYFTDKYLLPTEDAQYESYRRWGDPAQYASDHPVHTEYLRSAINEVFIPAKGWIKAEKFLKQLYAIDEYHSPKRMKVDSLNINYVDLNNRKGQADMIPQQFPHLLKQTVERTAQHRHIYDLIDEADKIRIAQAEQKNRSKAKNKDKEQPVR